MTASVLCNELYLLECSKCQSSSDRLNNDIRTQHEMALLLYPSVDLNSWFFVNILVVLIIFIFILID